MSFLQAHKISYEQKRSYKLGFLYVSAAHVSPAKFTYS